MQKQLSFTAYCASLGLIALLSTALQSDVKFSEHTLSDNQNSSRFENATINAYGDMAHLLYRLSSPNIDYQPHHGFEFEQPEFVYQSAHATPLNLSARRGLMENDSALIELLGNVSIYHLNPKNDMPEYLYTSDATINLDQKRAYTAAKATFRQQNKITEGIGMIADLEKQTIKLQSNIKVLNIP